MDTTVLAWFAAVLFVALAVFQLALATGAPLGHLVYGGRRAETDHRLPRNLRIVSLFASLVLLAFAWIMLARAGVVETNVSDTVLTVAAWMVVAFLALNTAGNLAAQHWFEKWVMGGMTALLVIVCSVVAATGAG